MQSTSRRWIVVAIFFLFMLLHQSDKLLIGPLTTPIMETFGINEVQMGAVFTGALIVGAICYPLWGYLYDRYARPKLLALASFLWGSTTWLSAIAPSYPIFLASRASTGIDDSSYPGIYSLVCDYFAPKTRGKIYGLLQLTMPLGYLTGMVLAMVFRQSIGWRGVFYMTGSIGVVLAVAIFFLVREAPRGQSEPEMEGVQCTIQYRFNWRTALGLFRKPTLLLLFIQGFFGVFPWNVITYWFFRYLETERGYASDAVLMTMAPVVIILAAGYFVGGSLGDFLFKRTPRGRAIVATIGVLAGALLLVVTLGVPVDQQFLFLVLLAVTALFIPFAAPNVVSTVFDVTEPEVRSTATAVQYFIESAGAATAPLLAGWIAMRSNLHTAILSICVSTWIICGIAYGVVAYLVPRDIAKLRRQMQARAERERAEQGA